MMRSSIKPHRQADAYPQVVPPHPCAWSFPFMKYCACGAAASVVSVWCSYSSFPLGRIPLGVVHRSPFRATVGGSEVCCRLDTPLLYHESEVFRPGDELWNREDGEPIA